MQKGGALPIFILCKQVPISRNVQELGVDTNPVEAPTTSRRATHVNVAKAFLIVRHFALNHIIPLKEYTQKSSMESPLLRASSQ